MQEKRSNQLFEEALAVLPGGVSSPVRSFKKVAGNPFFVKRGSGPYLFDEDNHTYVDYVLSWGPLILGHAHPTIVKKIKDAAVNGSTYGAPTKIEVELAQKIKSLMPAIEKIRFVSSGTEAVMSAVRLARGFTGRNKIIKFIGCYHGHLDSLLVAAGSGCMTLGVPDSLGVPTSFTEHTLLADYNDLTQVEQLFTTFKDDIAAIIVEPVAGNMNCVLPNEGFLAGLKKIAEENDALLIFDEVITGFRVALGGAQSYFGVTPDLTILGKIIGGGLPAAAFGGRAEIMNYLAPLGGVYQAGTLSGNPLAMTAGLATLQYLEAENPYRLLSERTKALVMGIQKVAERAQVPFKAHYIGAMFGIFFTDLDKIENEKEVNQSHTDKFQKFFHGMLQEGFYFAPSPFESGFLSIVHDDIIIERTIRSAETVFKKL